jgi:5-(carboxyamino)imidazole ribonucleotide synthase
VLGGGQLGRMLGLAGIPLGLQFRFLDPSPDAPAAAVGTLVVGDLGDAPAVADVAAGADVVTYEWEGVPADTARLLADKGMVVRPGARSLEISQDRLAEKEAFRARGIPTAAFAPVSSRDELPGAVDEVGGFPAVLKTRRGGYDGKGQRVLHDGSALIGAWDVVGATPCIVEQLVAFDRELSVLVVRGHDGETRCWPLVANEHADGILRVSRAPAPGLDPTLQARGEAIARRVAEELDHVGVLAVELFEVGGELLANEIAPRVHNSGHWTIEGAATSQFENHLRATLALPLGPTAARGASAMVNCIGAMPPRDGVLAVAGAHLHDYGKTPRPGRKLGHVTLVGPDHAALDGRIRAVRALLPA